jgi:hypothetical protein
VEQSSTGACTVIAAYVDYLYSLAG